ncbi:MAG: hypothetical protein ACLSEY_13210 [Enterocloster sp.]
MAIPLRHIHGTYRAIHGTSIAPFMATYRAIHGTHRIVATLLQSRNKYWTFRTLENSRKQHLKNSLYKKAQFIFAFSKNEHKSLDFANLKP